MSEENSYIKEEEEKLPEELTWKFCLYCDNIITNKREKHCSRECYLKNHILMVKAYYQSTQNPKSGFRKGNLPWNKGLTKEDDTRLKSISNAKKGTWEENFGKEISKKLKQQMSERVSGKNHPLWHVGHTKKTRLKISGAKFGKKNPKLSETRKKLIREGKIIVTLPKKDTSIEIKIQNFLSLLHIEYFAHKYMKIEHGYQCDIFIPSTKTIIEVDGCYWHGCSICNLNKNDKTKAQMEKDNLRTKELVQKGYKVIRLWEHDIKKMELNDFHRRLNGR